MSGWARAESALLQSEARLRAVLETAVDAIITIDGNGRIQSVNPATLRLFGYAEAEMMGQPVSMLMPSPYREEHDGYLSRYLRTGEKRIIGIGREVQALRKDGSVFSIDLAVSEVEPFKLFTAIIRDISERKLSESRLREADRLASIGTLAAGLGHDMNNVLLPVRAHLNALNVAGYVSATERRKHVSRIQKGIAYLQQLADGLHFLVMDPEHADDAECATDLRAWWDQSGVLLTKAVPKHVRVTTSLGHRLPKIAVAAHALTQAVLNLFVNAGEAIPAPTTQKRRQGHVRLHAQLEADGSKVRLCVTDNGNGMPDEVRRHAFDMFFTTKPRGLGTGLGLAMVRKVVDRAGGSVEIESAPGKGTTVALILPAIARRNAGHENQVAAVRIGDGRAASLVRNQLEASGVRIVGGDDPNRADIWVVQPSAASLVDARAWRKARPKGRLVLFGQPEARSASAWRSLDPVIIRDPDGLDGIRDALGLAMAQP